MATTNTNESRAKDNFKRSYSYPKDKDEDNDNKGARSHKAMDAKKRGSQSKGKEQQPVKLETMKRLEREKKVVLKKNHKEDTKKIKKPPMKQKRSTKDWTKSYEYGLLDEDKDYTEY